MKLSRARPDRSAASCALVVAIAAAACVPDDSPGAGDATPTCDACDDGLGVIDGPVAIAGDTDRDGALTPADVVNRADWTWASGALLLANLDDDDGDGMADAGDGVVNGADDERDLALFEIRIGPGLDPRDLRLSIEVLGAPRVRAFVRAADTWRALDPAPFAAERVLRVGVESAALAGSDRWDGFATIQVTVLDLQGAPIATDRARARVAPWLMLPNTARTDALFISTGRYAGAVAMSRDLQATNVVAVREYPTDSWQEMWMQDTMEIGYSEIPGSRMHLVWRNSRCGAAGSCDRFGASLLGKDVGVFTVPVTGTTGYGSWDDWFGNLEVTPATAQAPLGRIFHGKNLCQGYRDFLVAQGTQAPVELDPTWLLIKHVDEFVSFVPAPDGSPRMLVASPRRAGEVLQDGYYGPYNRSLQVRIDADVATLRAAIGLAADQVIELPQYYSAGGEADWSSPVNSVYLNGTVALGNTLGAQSANQLAGTAQGAAIAAALRGAGVEVAWVDDSAYQPNHGNVHCGTNTVRAPDPIPFWSALAGR